MADQEAQGQDAAALARHALRLLEDYEGCEERWADADEDVLNREIDQYRGSITAINKHLQTLGVAIDEEQDDDAELEEDQAPEQAPEQPEASAAAPEQQQQAAPAEPEAAKEFAHLGEEGVDFTLGSVDDIDPSEWQVPPHCIPIHANVTTYDWRQLYGHTQFDVIMMDPPWQLATANPTRGVSLGYSQLNDNDIVNLPVPQLQSNGFLFVWVINAKYKFTLDLFERWGYRWAAAACLQLRLHIHACHARTTACVHKTAAPCAGAACSPLGYTSTRAMCTCQHARHAWTGLTATALRVEITNISTKWQSPAISWGSMHSLEVPGAAARCIPACVRLCTPSHAKTTCAHGARPVSAAVRRTHSWSQST